MKSSNFNISSFFFFYFALVAVYVIFMPKVLNDVGYNTEEIGIIFSIAPLTRFLTPFFFLKRFELNRKLFLISSVIGVLSSLLFYFTIHSFWIFLVVNVFFGVALSLTLPFIETIAIAKLKENYGTSRLFGSIGFMLIVLILGEFLTNENIAIFYLIFSMIFMVIFGFLASKEEAELKKDSNLEESKPFSIFKNLNLWISIFIMQFSFGAFYSFFVIYATERGISLSMTSYLWTLSIIFEVLIFKYQAPILKKYSLINIIKFAMLITSFRWFLYFSFSDNIYVYFFAQTLHAFSFALYHSAVISYLYKLYDNKKLAQQFLYGISYGLGGFLGAIVAGFLYGDYLYLYACIFTFVGFLFIAKQKY